MLFPFLLILVPAVLIVALARWAKTDEDDIARKVVTSIVQLSCLMCMALGVMRFAQRAADGPAPTADADPVALSRPTPSVVSRSVPKPDGYRQPAIQPTAAELVVAERKAEEDRQRALAGQQAFAEQNRRNLEEAQRQAAAAQNGPSTSMQGEPEAGSMPPASDPNAAAATPPSSAEQPGSPSTPLPTSG